MIAPHTSMKPPAVGRQWPGWMYSAYRRRDLTIAIVVMQVILVAQPAVCFTARGFRFGSLTDAK